MSRLPHAAPARPFGDRDQVHHQSDSLRAERIARDTLVNRQRVTEWCLVLGNEDRGVWIGEALSKPGDDFFVLRDAIEGRRRVQVELLHVAIELGHEGRVFDGSAPDREVTQALHGA